MKNQKQDIVFTAGESGTLLALVRRALADTPSGKAKSYLEHRMISVDGVVTSRYDYPVARGQTVKIRREASGAYNSPLEVLYEDADLFAVNKPAGLLTVATDTEKENTAIRLLRDRGMNPLFVVHRLDRDTSGVLLFAKSAETRDALQNAWESTRRREYAAVCEGVFEQKSGRCDTVLRETSAHRVYSAPSGEGKRAVTLYEVLRENKKYSYLRVLLETGRKNQIRVHMQELSHPVVGDKKYGARGNPLGRLGLHASVLELTHPRTGATLTLTAKPERRFRLPKDE
ncbi:MAG: RluA family pseudouridine synthase [Oscillospiraceae bacterium]|jgi:RluA family pseudouridine synthase|nr:RluA family pseudouridine synthase [Oscillospiraceae bacterium]